MAVRTTIQIGDPRLKAPNQQITDVHDPKINQVIEDLTDTMRENQLIGMAAPQIGENYKIFVTEPRPSKFRTLDQSDQLRVYINPKIVWNSPEEIELFEGCGSVVNASFFAPVIRPNAIKIEYQNQHNQLHWLKCDGILARVIQHEYDHLHGIEFLEKISDYKRAMTIDWYIQNVKNDPIYIERSRITMKESDTL